MTTNGKRFAGVKAVVFDLDGTLIDSKKDLALAMNATLKHLGRKEIEAERIYSYVGGGVQLLVKRALAEGTTEEEIERGMAYFLEYYKAHMLDNTIPYPGVREALDNLAGRELAVLTNKPVNFSKAILNGLGMARYFRYVYGGNSFEKKKPDPVGLNTLLREFGAGPRETMMVGDSDVDIQTARNAGTWACGVTYGMGSAKLPASEPDLLLDTLEDLPGYLEAKSE
ncbi:MAG TPA: HAD-IA family hydrolase [Candidatus Acidoferrales bacterium]|nr:HAD-IA family hydrolase [Candidatus Acidoferrales bacterium]